MTQTSHCTKGCISLVGPDPHAQHEGLAPRDYGCFPFNYYAALLTLSVSANNMLLPFLLLHQFSLIIEFYSRFMM